MLSKRRLSCRVIPSDSRRHASSAWSAEVPSCCATPRDGPWDLHTDAHQTGTCLSSSESSTHFFSPVSIQSASTPSSEPSSGSLSSSTSSLTSSSLKSSRQFYTQSFPWHSTSCGCIECISVPFPLLRIEADPPASAAISTSTSNPSSEPVPASDISASTSPVSSLALECSVSFSSSSDVKHKESVETDTIQKVFIATNTVSTSTTHTITPARFSSLLDKDRDRLVCSDSSPCEPNFSAVLTPLEITSSEDARKSRSRPRGIASPEEFASQTPAADLLGLEDCASTIGSCFCLGLVRSAGGFCEDIQLPAFRSRLSGLGEHGAQLPPPFSPPPPLPYLSSPRGDSDPNAEVDSMSSSDLERCQDLSDVSSPRSLVSHDVTLAPSGDVITINNSYMSRNPGVSLLLPVGTPPGGGMSGKKLEESSPLPEDSEELPAMWEDGGGLSFKGDNDGLGSAVVKNDLDCGPWMMLTTDNVRIFSDSDTANSNNANVDGEDEGNNLEDRSNLIEQTLAEIYESPFQQLIYASKPDESDSPTHRKTSARLGISESNNYHQHLNRTKLLSVDENQNGGSGGGGRVGNRERMLNSRGNFSPSGKDGGGGDFAEQNGEEGDDDDNNDEDDDEDDVDGDDSRERQAVAAKGEGLGFKTQRLRSASVDMVDFHFKASIARAAQRAVHGYRTCDDADSYVGTRVKPTLILARAPPSPSGILRRTNRKAAVKVAQGNVRWADGRQSRKSASDDDV